MLPIPMAPPSTYIITIMVGAWVAHYRVSTHNCLPIRETVIALRDHQGTTALHTTY